MILQQITSDLQHPFVGRDVPWLVRDRAAAWPDRTFLVWESLADEGGSWTFGAFAEAVETMAANLSQAGLRPGERVLIHLDNCPEFLFAWFGCARLGAVAVTTNTRSPVDEVTYFARHSAARLAITQPKYVDVVRAAMPAGAPIYVRRRDPGIPGEAPPPEGLRGLDVLLAPAGPLALRAADPVAPVSVQYTSGTTSRPKGVVWTHANALWAARINASHAQLGASDVTPVFLPLFHTNAIGYSTLATLWSGGTIVLQSRYSASRFWEIAERWGCTWANMIGFTIQALLVREAPPAHRFRFWACAADIAAIRDRWGIKTIGWWGMTETVSHGTVSDLATAGPEMSMGRPAPEYGVRILDDEGQLISPGGTGRLQVRGIRGLSLFLEYLDDAEATARAFTDDGWMETGDRVRLATSGDLFFAEREKDMLKIGAENVAASEIERVIQGLAGVAEVAVVGRPDPMLDEVAVAFVVRAQGAAIDADTVVRHCASLLADFKTPRAVFFLDALPRGTLDKVLKKELRALAAQDRSGAA